MHYSLKSRTLSSAHMHILVCVTSVQCGVRETFFWWEGAGWDGIFPHSCDRLAIRSRLTFLHSPSFCAHSCPLLFLQPPLCSHHVTETERFVHTTGARFMTEIRSTDQSDALCDWNVQTGAIVWDLRWSVELTLKRYEGGNKTEDFLETTSV